MKNKSNSKINLASVNKSKKKSKGSKTMINGFNNSKDNYKRDESGKFAF